MAAEALARAAQLEPSRKLQQQQQAPPNPERPSPDEKQEPSQDKKKQEPSQDKK